MHLRRLRRLTAHQAAFGGFSPLTLPSPIGYWDMGDFSTLFQDAAGTTPVTGVEQTVALMRDKSSAGNHFSTSMTSTRPVVSARVNLLNATETLSTQSVTTVATNYTLYFEGTGTIALSGTKTGTYSAGSNAVTGVTAGTLTLTVSGTVTRADLRASNDGAGLPVYQRVTNATNYDTVGFPFYLKFDGIDDTLATSSINLTSTDVVTYIGGIRKITTGTAIALESSASSSLNNGTFAFAAPSAAGNYYFRAKGSVDYPVTYTPYSEPISNILSSVLSSKGSSAATAARTRINGAAVSGSTTGSGTSTGNFGNHPLYLGSRGAASLYFSGRVYPFVLCAAQPADAQIAACETFFNSRMKVY